jgi:16S rRNA (cytidine1402-2'-O)-methyltransferase
VCATPETVVLFEAPGRTASTLGELAEATPTRGACVARELTKVHEELTRGTLADLAQDPREWRGEVVLVLGPYDPGSRSEVTDDALDARIDEALEAGDHAKSIADRLAALSGRPRREVYARVLQRKRRG